jgi:putative transposase
MDLTKTVADLIVEQPTRDRPLAKHRKVYRFRMEPTTIQVHHLSRMAGARRWVWNWALRCWKDSYVTTGESICLKQLSAELTALKKQPETAWLVGVSTSRPILQR